MLRIRELRLENNLTQKELAEKISSTSKNIWAYENQISIPPLDVLIKLADFFNCSIDYLANHSDDFGNVVIHTTAPAPQLSDEEKELLENYRKLPSGLKIRAQAYLSGMVEALTPEKKKTPDADKQRKKFDKIISHETHLL